MKSPKSNPQKDKIASNNEVEVGGDVSDSVIVSGSGNEIHIGDKKDPPIDKEKLKQLVSQAIQQELKGDFWDSLQSYYEIKRIDPLYPRVDIKISELEREYKRIKTQSIKWLVPSSVWTLVCLIVGLGSAIITFVGNTSLMRQVESTSVSLIPTSVVQSHTHLPVTSTLISNSIHLSTITPVKTNIPDVTSTPDVVCVDSMGFDASTIDITIPDGTVVKPEQRFLKTWRIQNTGSCVWTEAYKLVYVSGDVLLAEPKILNIVLPKEQVDISVWFVAPNTKGEYKSFWGIANEDGKVLGKFFVKIIVN